MTVLFRGVYPILLSVFDAQGDFDERCQRRAIDFLLDAGAHGLVALANASEGYAVSDVERDRIMEVVLDHVRGRVPVIIGISHPSTRVAVERSRAAMHAGANGILSLPPFYGGWLADTAGIYRYFAELSDAVEIPIVVQDHPLSGIAMSPQFMARLAVELENIRYFKIEVPRAPSKIAETLALGGDAIAGIFGGMSGITFLEELDRGACGTMPSSAFPDVFAKVYAYFHSGLRAEAAEIFFKYLPLIRFELHLAGKSVQKELLRLGGIICSANAREPVPPSWDEQTREQFLALLLDSDLLALNYTSSVTVSEDGHGEAKVMR